MVSYCPESTYPRLRASWARIRPRVLILPVPKIWNTTSVFSDGHNFQLFKYRTREYLFIFLFIVFCLSVHQPLKIPYSPEINRYKYFLTVIATFSEYMWAKPIENNKGEEVTSVMNFIVAGKWIPKNLLTDDGKEFSNINFQFMIHKHKKNCYLK